MPPYRPNATTILLLTALGAAALSACASSSATNTPQATSVTSPVTSASTATGTAGPPGSSSSTTTSPGRNGGNSGNNGNGGNKAIPQLAGDTVGVAELYLQQAGLRAGHTLQKANTEYQSGLVITTSPYAGDMVPSGYAVDLLVSTGSPGCQQPRCAYVGKFITMPDVLGQTVPQVTTALALDGITFGRSAVEASSAPRGTVICTDPAPGTLFLNTAPVGVGVSSGDPGSPPDTVCVPSAGPPTSPAAPPPTSPSGPPPTSPTGPPPTSPTAPPTSPAQPPVSP